MKNGKERNWLEQGTGMVNTQKIYFSLQALHGKQFKTTSKRK